jgi:iron complex outermembrane recepter protein
MFFAGLRPFARVSWALVFVSVFSVSAAPAGQGTEAGAIRGRLVHSVTGEPIPNVPVLLEEARRTAVADASGTFEFTGLPPGTYHVLVRAAGFTTRRTEIDVNGNSVGVTVRVDPELHYTEVVSVSPGTPRSAFESYQPAAALVGQDLYRELEATVSATIADQPGVAERSLGPGSARPVIRGLEGDRVLILEDFQRTGDISSQSGDHGVTINPAAARRIEVVRGPATLLYGANAIGGLVNVLSDRVPDRRLDGMTGNVLFDLGSAAGEAGGSGQFSWGNGVFALTAGGSGRRSGDVATPLGDIENSHLRQGTGSFGLSWTGARAFVGGSYAYDDTRYGVPILEEGDIQLTPRRHQFTMRSAGEGFGGLFESYRATVGHRRYQHDELEGDEIGTRFRNNTTEFEILGGHRPRGRLSGSVGGWVLNRAFEAEGAEALSPPVDQVSAAAFVYEEVGWPHFTVQFGGRLEHTRFQPQGGLPNREFTNLSGSVGLLYRPPAVRDAITLALSVARAARNPALEELYFFGEHAGNFSFEIGNAELESEKAIGLDASFRWRLPRIAGEFTYFRNSINDYIFRNPISEEEFEERFGDDDHGHGHGHGHDDEFGFIEFVAADSLLQGFEAHTDVQVAQGLTAELGVDYVRGQLRRTGDPLPRIPPFRFKGGLRYQWNALQAGGEVVSAARQTRVFDEETETEGYSRLRLFTSYSFQQGRSINTITARLDNATNTLYRNHLSYIKDLVPEMGRNFKLIYSVRF